MRYERTWPTAEVPPCSSKRPVSQSETYWERRLTGLVANSQFSQLRTVEYFSSNVCSDCEGPVTDGVDCMKGKRREGL
jgi:hypothetical protein